MPRTKNQLKMDEIHLSMYVLSPFFLNKDQMSLLYVFIFPEIVSVQFLVKVYSQQINVTFIQVKYFYFNLLSLFEEYLKGYKIQI